VSKKKVSCANGAKSRKQRATDQQLEMSAPRGDPSAKECTWDRCGASLSSDAEFTAHLENHSRDALTDWIAGSKCTWRGCPSKAVFKTSKAYNHHLKNIHTQPLICPEPRCSYKKPFRNEDDLNRHKLTAHLKQHRFECPYESCESEPKTFARKDKWLQHIRETEHENDALCPYHHCRSTQSATSKQFVTRKEISKHFGGHSTHAESRESGYQCGLGSCGNNLLPESWSRNGLRDHLGTHHGIKYFSAIWNLQDSGTRVFMVDHLRHENSWHDCTLCAPQEPVEQDAQMVEGMDLYAA
jgi:hypothetical protein